MLLRKTYGHKQDVSLCDHGDRGNGIDNAYNGNVDCTSDNSDNREAAPRRRALFEFRRRAARAHYSDEEPSRPFEFFVRKTWPVSVPRAEIPAGI